MEKREQAQTLTQQMQYYTMQELRQETRVFRKEMENKTDYFRLNNFIELAAMTQGFYLALHDYEKCLS